MQPMSLVGGLVRCAACQEDQDNMMYNLNKVRHTFLLTSGDCDDLMG